MGEARPAFWQGNQPRRGGGAGQCRLHEEFVCSEPQVRVWYSPRCRFPVSQALLKADREALNRYAASACTWRPELPGFDLDGT